MNQPMDASKPDVESIARALELARPLVPPDLGALLEEAARVMRQQSELIADLRGALIRRNSDTGR